MNTQLIYARIARPCTADGCGKTIEPRQPYVRHTYYPSEPDGRRGWPPITQSICRTCADQQGETIRDQYGVPAFVGAKVVYDGQVGQIISLHGGFVWLRLADGQVLPLHPTYLMEYQ